MRIKDQFILSKLKSGDLRTFESLFHRHYPGMCRYAYSILRKEEIAEEVVQDVFFNIWKNRQDLQIENMQSYLYRSVYNNSMMVLRKAKKESPLDETWADRQVYSGPDPAQEMGKKELDERIMETLNKLPERTREIFTMNRFEGLKYRDIAHRLSVSVKTVEANMGKALKALRSSLDEFIT